jgi:thymidylate kinase
VFKLLLGKSFFMGGKLIAFVGVDGTGKSSLANAVKKRLEKKNVPVKYVWMRMNYLFSRPFLLICRLTGLTKRPVVNGHKISVHEFYRFKPMAKLIQYTHFIDTFFSWVKNIYFPLYLKKKVVICDRFVHDILVDYAIEGHEWDIFSKRIARLFNLLVPRNAKFFLINVAKEKILKRKNDVIDFDKYFDQRYLLYDELKNNNLLNVINNDGSIDLALSRIFKELNLD